MSLALSVTPKIGSVESRPKTLDTVYFIKCYVLVWRIGVE